MEGLYNSFKVNYILAVLSLQQDFSALTVLVQQVFPFAHFFFFLPLSARATPVIINAAVANKNTFFIYQFY